MDFVPRLVPEFLRWSIQSDAPFRSGAPDRPPSNCAQVPHCRACGDTAGNHFFGTERMFNLGGSFAYLQCNACGTLSAETVPDDLASYYPENGYYSFSTSETKRGGGLRERINSLYERLIGILPLNLDLVRRYVPDTSARILDVGSGAGQKLRHLLTANYHNLTGVDPFLPRQLEQETPFRLKRGTVVEAGGNWDLIMYHHVLEHIADPGAELATAAAGLKDYGYLLVRIPVADSWAFTHYGTNWVQLDPPRHLCVPTRRALVALGRNTA